MNCSKCGTLNASNAKFCSSCGTRLESAEATATVDPAAPPYTAPYAEEGSPAQPIPPMAPPMGAPAQAPPPPAYNGAPGQAPPRPYNPAPPLDKPYKTEFVLGLIGSIVGCIIFLVMFISGISLLALGGYSYGFYGYDFAAAGAGSLVGSFFVLAAFILGFIGSSKVNKGNGKGGILLTIAGGLGFIAMLIGIRSSGWSGLFYFPLLLTAGIMALSRRGKVEGRR